MRFPQSFYCQLSIRTEELKQHMLSGATSNCFALVDSSANINIGMGVTSPKDPF
jgi:hypothetical protein